MKSELDKAIQSELFDLNLKYFTNRKFRNRIHLTILAVIILSIIGNIVSKHQKEEERKNDYYERLKTK